MKYRLYIKKEKPISKDLEGLDILIDGAQLDIMVDGGTIPYEINKEGLKKRVDISYQDLSMVLSVKNLDK
jgi:hypothetical protein